LPVVANDPLPLPAPLPRWVTGPWVPDGAGPAPPVALRAGAALMALDAILRADPVWAGALRMRLALQAAVASARMLRLAADADTLRDALHLTRPGDDPGPAGRLHLVWRQLAVRPHDRLPDALARLADVAGGGASAAELTALITAEATLAADLGWSPPLPLLGSVLADPALRAGQGRRAFAVGGDGWAAWRWAVTGLAATRAHALARDIAARSARLTAAAATLRTRDQGRGLSLVLSDDSVAPWRMVGPQGFNSDRAARRFCESLHATGALRRLTDRATFRVYGV
jgi:hypothetical protein